MRTDTLPNARFYEELAERCSLKYRRVDGSVWRQRAGRNPQWEDLWVDPMQVRRSIVEMMQEVRA